MKRLVLIISLTLGACGVEGDPIAPEGASDKVVQGGIGAVDAGGGI